MIYCLSLFPHEGFNNVKVMYFCNNVDDYLAVDKIRMFRPNKLSIVPCEATRTRAWVRRSLDTNMGGSYPHLFYKMFVDLWRESGNSEKNHLLQ